MARVKRLRKRLIIIGAGFGGLNVALRLANADYDIVVVDRTNHHLFQPLLYQVATAALAPEDIASPVRKILREQENTLVLMSEVTRIDVDAREVHLHNHSPLTYDILVVAPGARHSYFGKNEWEKFAPGLKTLDDALTIRENILVSFEHAELCDSHSQAQTFMNFVVIGGGPTGVELAGAIAEIANHAMLKNFKRIDSRNARVYIVEGAERLLPTMSPELGKRAQSDLERLGVEAITGKMVTEITGEGVTVGERLIRSTNIIWAAGNQAARVLETLGAPTDRQGRVIVEPNLSLAKHPEIFVVGDAAHCKTKDETPLPGVAPVAIQQGRYVAKIIADNLVGKETRPFKYRDNGTMATIGRSRAVAEVFGMKYGGFLAWCTWSMIHLMYLTLYKNRARVLIEWLYGYLTGQRGARLIRRPSEEESIKTSLRTH